MSRIGEYFLGNKGGFNYVNVILILILIVIIYAVWVWGIGAYMSFSLGHFAEGESIKATEKPDDEIRNTIFEHARSIGIDMSSFKLSVSRTGGMIVTDFSFDRSMGFGDKFVTFEKKVTREYGDIQHFEDDSGIKKYN